MSKSHPSLWGTTRATLAEYSTQDIWVPLMGCTVVSQHQVCRVEYADKGIVVMRHLSIGTTGSIDMELCAWLNYCRNYAMYAVRLLDGIVYSGSVVDLEWRGA